jgi:two-component system chemotaxis sensor kinase CheA
MNSILGLTELMLEKVDLEPRNKERLEVILSSGKRLMTLINDILDLSKIEAGKVELLYENVIIEEILTEVSAAISMLAKEKHIDFEVVRKVDTSTVINTDKAKVVQVLINLLGNAVKYTDKGSVNLKIAVRNGQLSFEVIDTGIGISREEINLIFEEFRQSDSSKSRRRGGTGLGLAISKKLTEILDGNLSVKSELNQGSSFTFSIPFNHVKSIYNEEQIERDENIEVSGNEIKTDHATNDLSEVNSDIRTETHKIDSENIQPANEESQFNVMIVDDDANTLFTIAEIVRSINCNPILANNGKECLEQLEKQTPDLILLDIIMPEMDGFKTIDNIRKNNKWTDIPVYAVTAKAMKNDNEIILKHGFTDYIPKPVNPAFVTYKIQSLITQLKTT